jgi:hypothetical protein
MPAKAGILGARRIIIWIPAPRLRGDKLSRNDRLYRRNPL